MCGVPYHSAEGYIQRLIEKGYKVAICEQMEDASVTKGMVRREIVRVVTPGTIMDGKVVRQVEQLHGVCHGNGRLDVFICMRSVNRGALCDVSSIFGGMARDEIGLYEPSEIIGDAAADIISSQALPGDRNIVYTAWDRREDALVRTQFGEPAWARLEEERRACISLLISYLSEMQKRSLGPDADCFL